MADAIHAATPTYRAAIWIAGAIAFAAIGGGIVAIIWNAQSQTQFNFLGLTMTTGHVGVALVGLGAAVVILVFRRVFASLDGIAQSKIRRQ